MGRLPHLGPGLDGINRRFQNPIISLPRSFPHESARSPKRQGVGTEWPTPVNSAPSNPRTQVSADDGLVQLRGHSASHLAQMIARIFNRFAGTPFRQKLRGMQVVAEPLHQEWAPAATLAANSVALGMGPGEGEIQKVVAERPGQNGHQLTEQERRYRGPRRARCRRAGVS